MRARYDGLADWYEERFVEGSEPHQPGLLELLGPGSGPCLDIGCGTGRNFESIRASGRTIVGLDFSKDQLGLARTRTDGPLLHGDAAVLPFADESFDTAITMWISTDVDDFGAVLREAARVLRPGGILVAYGVHPCFNGPHVCTKRTAAGPPIRRTARPVGTTIHRGGATTGSAAGSACATCHWPST